MKNYFDLTGKVALITGASAGLGVQFARALGNQGAKLALAARRVEKLDSVKAELESLGYECFTVKCDISSSSDAAEMVAKVCEKYGRIDILVNNAGVGGSSATVAMTDEAWSKTINTNLNGTFYVGREVAKVMLKQNYGKIINLCSIHSNVALTPLAESVVSYCASKGGVQMLTKAWAAEFAGNNITVNALAPGSFQSEMNPCALEGPALQLFQTFCPMGRIGNNGELDGALIYFASDASSYTTGQVLHIDGGWTTL